MNSHTSMDRTIYNQGYKYVVLSCIVDFAVITTKTARTIKQDKILNM